MAALRIFVAALALAATSPAGAQSVVATPVEVSGIARWRAHIEKASARFGIPAAWIERVMRAESGGRVELNGRPIVSHAGAMGLMQLMPGTWAEMRSSLGLGSDPHNPRDNIVAGTFYLRLMYDRFGYPGLFGAYNAGPARYAAWLQGRARLPAETRAYLAAVAGSGAGDVAGGAKRAPELAPLERPSLFFVRHGAARTRAADTGGGSLFALRREQPMGD